jgi:hypothetical protein
MFNEAKAGGKLIRQQQPGVRKSLKYESNLESIISAEIEQQAEEAITDYAKRRLLRSQVRFESSKPSN